MTVIFEIVSVAKSSIGSLHLGGGGGDEKKQESKDG